MAVAVAAAATGAIAAAMIPALSGPRHTAEASVIVARDGADGTAAARPDVVAGLLASRPVIDDMLRNVPLATRLQVDLDRPGALDALVNLFSANIRGADLATRVRERIEADVYGSDGAVTLRVRAHDPLLARDAANALLDAFARLGPGRNARSTAEMIAWIDAEIGRLEQATDAPDRDLMDGLRKRREALASAVERAGGGRDILRRADMPATSPVPAEIPAALGGALAGLLVAIGGMFVADRRRRQRGEVIQGDTITWTENAGVVAVPVIARVEISQSDDEQAALPVAEARPAATGTATSPSGAVPTSQFRATVDEDLGRINATLMADGSATIAILSFGANPSGTSIADYLGEAASHDGLRSVVVDTVRRTADERSGFSDLLSGEADFADVIGRHPRCRAHHIGAGSRTVEGELLTTARLGDAITALESTYDLVVMDMGSVGRDAGCIALISGTNHVALVADPGPDAEWVLRLLAMSGVQSVSVIPVEDLAASRAA
ncbi:hypothetical protein [Methylobrevis pamukkalensis]|uniref:Chain length determinant protein n=1 Tax=Methylobrevis pamukkalensis TaxID=1439726 RepID=A0A1E3GYL0_9HYPH|nr:hypothetical protein [Methylobrevis pamukkalensis]ODN69157.1 hypothetical protein A6302_03533 [Methylobrevis pamukkalensis]